MASGINGSGCFFCSIDKQTIIAEFTHFRIIKNNFPYDEVAEVHDMIYPKRHILGNELSNEEKDELQTIKGTYCKEQGYQYLFEGITRLSIPSHVHFHLLTLKEK